MVPVNFHHLPARVELFRSMNSAEIKALLRESKARRFSSRFIITDQDEPSEHFYLLWKGKVRYFYETREGKKLILRWLAPGQVFGVAALVSGSPTYLVSTEAVQDSIVLIWSARAIRSLARRFPLLLENALMIAKDYMAWYVTAHAGLCSHTARERLSHVLVELAETVGRKLPQGTELGVTNEELASAANITPYTASRIISGWQRAGIIRKRRGKIVVCSTKLLSSER